MNQIHLTSQESCAAMFFKCFLYYQSISFRNRSGHHSSSLCSPLISFLTLSHSPPLIPVLDTSYSSLHIVPLLSVYHLLACYLSHPHSLPLIPLLTPQSLLHFTISLQCLIDDFTPQTCFHSTLKGDRIPSCLAETIPGKRPHTEEPPLQH